jgi:hypothetical protein
MRAERKWVIAGLFLTMSLAASLTATGTYVLKNNFGTSLEVHPSEGY